MKEYVKVVQQWWICIEFEVIVDELVLMIDGLIGEDFEWFIGIVVLFMVLFVLYEVWIMFDQYWLLVLYVLIEFGVCIGIFLFVDNLKEVGVDCIVNCLVVYDWFWKVVIVVDFGFLICVDVVLVKGEFFGGVIVFGVQVFFDVVVVCLVVLCCVEFVCLCLVVGKNIVECM